MMDKQRGGILGVGVDLIEVNRIRKAHRRWGDQFLRRIFTEEEVRHCFSRIDPYQSLAARFAGKEAAAKALSSGFGAQLSFRSIAIVSKKNGAPQVILEETKSVLLLGKKLLVSLSHTAKFALAQVVLCGSLPSDQTDDRIPMEGVSQPLTNSDNPNFLTKN
jgi:holo-[acyl-carrier protein] synthase